MPTTVKSWREAVIIPTYPELPPDPNPMFLESRVYQGSSGKVYPLPFTDRISDTREDRSWDAIHLENEFLRLMVLPQIGGRIHVGEDKITGYDFFYRQNVIKPALVGLAGPWISGGVEFNWPQHHRPATYLPVDAEIEEHPDGSRTIWLSDHDPMTRMKGMHGVCLHPGKACVEVKVRLYNRTPFVQTFLWWANVAARVHESYQSFFPPDVHYVADHAKRAVSTFPRCSGRYYGVDYAANARSGKRAVSDTKPSSPANDLSWYWNIPVPTSYMCLGTRDDFFGGYDHAAEAGLVHVANHHIAPGKKQWTWGNHEFGHAWDRQLTDADGPYIELMAGVYTDNQPDFSFLQPGETKTFSQFWYPIRQIGPAQKATTQAAVSLRTRKGRARIGLCVTEEVPGGTLRLSAKGKTVWERKATFTPPESLVEEVVLAKGITETDLRLELRNESDRLLLDYTPPPPKKTAPPDAATEPPLPPQIPSNDELYVTGLHLDQYRHATRSPEPYWREALRRDPDDARCNNALGLWHLRRGEFGAAEERFRRAIGRLTRRNPNPYDGEPHYNLGLALRFLGRNDEAYDAFYKACWNQAWQSAGYLALAEGDCRRRDWHRALDHLDRSLRSNTDHLRSRNLKVTVLRLLGREEAAASLLRETLALDPLDMGARHLQGTALPCDAQTHLDLALDYRRAGFLREAITLLEGCPRKGQARGAVPLLDYYLGFLNGEAGDAKKALRHYRAAAQANPDYCFPARVEEIEILQAAMRANPRDARAPYYLGNLLYDKRRQEEALLLWEKSVRLDPSFSVAWRNLGIAYYNVRGDAGKAKRGFRRALQANPHDARVLFEQDQLWKRIGVAPSVRLRALEKKKAPAASRDDLSVELAALYNQTGQPERAHKLLTRRVFHPWEGGEGQVLGQFIRSCVLWGRRALAQGDAKAAWQRLEKALTPPRSLGEARHLLANQSDLYFWLGEARAAGGCREEARDWWERATRFEGDFQEMTVQSFSEMTYYQALSLRRLKKTREAAAKLRAFRSHAQRLLAAKASVDYFATSLPTMLLFRDDLQRRQEIAASFLLAQAELGLGRKAKAREWLCQTLALDANHALAADFRRDLE